MPWRTPQTVPFTRLGIVATIPSESGVFAILSGDSPLLISDSWNLKARLLELINQVPAPESFTVRFELCPDEDRSVRRQAIENLLRERAAPAPMVHSDFPGISFWAVPYGGWDAAAAETHKA